MTSAPLAPAVTSTGSRSRKARIDYASNDPDEILASNRIVATPFQISKHKKDAAKQWDIFYKNNRDGFFKDRHWTDREWTVLSTLDSAGEGEGPEGKGKGKLVLEVGCGTGAFVYPLLERYPSARFQAFDFSKRAVELVKNHPNYTPSRVHAFVHDLTCPPGSPSLVQQLASAPAEFWEPSSSSLPASPASPPPASASAAPVEAVATELPQRPDVISCVFVLSALPPAKQAAAVWSLVQVLAPGGTLLLRDYALYDQAQLRFHALPSQGYASVPSLLSGPLPTADTTPIATPSGTTIDPDAAEELGKPWYRRGDGTMTYFFTTEEVDRLVAEGCEEGYKMEGEVSVIEREMSNRAEGWGCTRRFVQGSWRKAVK